MERRRDAVGNHLPIGIEERNVQRHLHAGPRHDLALKGVAMNVDDARKQKQAAGVESLGARTFGIDARNEYVLYGKAAALNGAIGMKNARIFDRQHREAQPSLSKLALSYQLDVTVI